MLLAPAFPLLLLAAIAAARADVRLPAIFGDHMVLQQDAPLPVWGDADADEEIVVSFAGREARTRAAADGTWRVTLPALPANPVAQTFEVRGKNTVRFTDVLVGEVWLAGGQSNMAFPLSSAHEAATAVPQAEDAALRFFTVERRTAAAPQRHLRGRWQVCRPDAAKGFSAVAYFFARDLRAALGRPVGVIHSSWGGTPAQTWLGIDALRANPALARHVTAWEKAVVAHEKLAADPAPRAAYAAALQQWQAEVAPKFNAATRAYNAARAKGDTTAPRPVPERPEPDNPDPMDIPSPSKRPNTPAISYDAMIAPLAPYALRGALWYQGEANVGQAKDYEALLPALIGDWRRRWGQGDFPFLIVQLPDWARPGDDAALPELREAQRLVAARVPRTGLAVTIDLGDPKDVHPSGKRDVGLRLARLARRDVYGETIVAAGPTFRAAAFEGAAVQVTFHSADGGLVLGQSPWRPAGEAPYAADRLTGFELRGADRKWRAAEAKIDGAAVSVSHPEIAQPTGIRYAWTAAPRANLYNRAGLPAAPFRSEK